MNRLRLRLQLRNTALQVYTAYNQSTIWATTLIFLNPEPWGKSTDISQYRLRFGSSLLYKSVFYG
jgi:hypothetical protein